MTLKLEALRPAKYTEAKCNQDVRLKEWPYVRRCGKDAVGNVPFNLAVAFRLASIQICAEHAAELENHILDDPSLSSLAEYIVDAPKKDS